MKKLILLILCFGIFQARAQVNFSQYDVPSKGFATAVIKLSNNDLVAASNGIFFSTNDGDTWTIAKTSYDFSLDYTSGLYSNLNLLKSGLLIATAPDLSLIYSDDNGRTWSKIDFLPSEYTYDKVFVTESGIYLPFFTDSSEVIKVDQNLTSFEKINFNLPSLFENNPTINSIAENEDGDIAMLYLYNVGGIAFVQGMIYKEKDQPWTSSQFELSALEIAADIEFKGDSLFISSVELEIDFSTGDVSFKAGNLYLSRDIGKSVEKLVSIPNSLFASMFIYEDKLYLVSNDVNNGTSVSVLKNDNTLETYTNESWKAGINYFVMDSEYIVLSQEGAYRSSDKFGPFELWFERMGMPLISDFFPLGGGQSVAVEGSNDNQFGILTPTSSDWDFLKTTEILPGKGVYIDYVDKEKNIYFSENLNYGIKLYSGNIIPISTETDLYEYSEGLNGEIYLERYESEGQSFPIYSLLKLEIVEDGSGSKKAELTKIHEGLENIIYQVNYQGNIVVSGINQDGEYVLDISTDAGVNWATSQASLFGATKIFLSGQNDIYTFNYDGQTLDYRSLGGAPINIDLPQIQIEDVYVGDNFIALATIEGIKYSVDNGNTWTSALNIPSFSLKLDADNRLWALTYEGLFVSESKVVKVDDELSNSLQFNVYPNPATNVVNFVSTSPNSEVRITDMSGKTLFSGFSINKADVSKLSNGSYIINFITRKDNFSMPFKIQR